MSIISEVKCARCDRKYSGLRSRCPYCGARRIGRGKYSEESDNSKGKMLIGVLIMAALVIAVGVLLFTAPRTSEADAAESESVNSPLGSLNEIEGDNVTVQGSNPVSPTPTPSPTPEEIPELTKPAVRSVMITHNNKEKNDFTSKVGDTVKLAVRIEPVNIEEEIIWTSSNRSVFEVVATNTTGTEAKVTAVGKGTAIVTVTVGGVEDDCIVRVK